MTCADMMFLLTIVRSDLHGAHRVTMCKVICLAAGYSRNFGMSFILAQYIRYEAERGETQEHHSHGELEVRAAVSMLCFIK